jgi:hypothetical protein
VAVVSPHDPSERIPVTTLLHILPLALGAALSPALLGTSLELLVKFGARGVRMLLLYLLGAAVVVASAVALALVLPQHAPSDANRVLSDIVDVALAALLLVIAAVLVFRQPKPAPAAAHRPGFAQRLSSSRWVGAGILGLGVFMMVTNFSTLVLLLAGSHGLSAAGVDPLTRALGYALLAVGALAPILLPLVWVLVRPAAATRDLGRVDAALSRHGRVLGIVVSVATALYLLARGFGLI